MFASAQKLGAKARSHAAPAEAAAPAPDSRAARYSTAQAPAAHAAENRLTLQGSGRKKNTSDQAFASRTYSG